MPALLLIGLLASASATHIRSPALFRRSLMAPTPNPPTPSPTTSEGYRDADSPVGPSGLQDVASTGTTTVTVGHFITGTGLKKSTTYSSPSQLGGVKTLTTSAGTWGQEFSYSAVDVNGDTRTDIFETSSPAPEGITLDSVKFNQKNNVWMVDTNQGNAYKLATTGSVAGVYQTSPTGEHPLHCVAFCTDKPLWYLHPMLICGHCGASMP